MKSKTFVILAILTCCANNLSAQMSYREKYADVLQHYSKSESDSLKYKAALFLIDNMDGHLSPAGTAIDCYIQRIYTMRKTQGIRELRQAWNESLKGRSVQWSPDSALVSNGFLIDNIDESFKAWQQSVWRKDVPFAHFCRYILPYRINDEHIGAKWRKTLREQYAGIIDGVTDIRKAFAMVKDSVYKVIELSNPYCEYNLDPLTCNVIGRAECGQRCILLAAVLRALAIPAVVDVTPMWADYSQKGHGWVAVVLDNGDTYTVFEEDNIAKRFNPIDASLFLPTYHVTEQDNCPIPIKDRKTPAKVYRMCYEHVNKGYENDPHILATPFINDVSAEYGLTTKVTLRTEVQSTVYLCCYLSAKDWQPIAKAEAKNGKVTFYNVGKGSVCIAMTNEKGRRKVLTAPFLVGNNGIERFFKPNVIRKQAMTIDRKYPLCANTTDKWGAMIGGIFEGSMTADFKKAETIATISQMPYYMTTVKSKNHGKFRYLRYRAPKENNTLLAELQFYTTDKTGKEILLTGTHSGEGADSTQIEYVFDGNPATICKGQDMKYSITLDLGKGNEQQVSRIKFCPSTDLNFVEKGHLYELYYFDKTWEMINRVYSKSDRLTFENVPSDAILLLKDKSAGKEERIFEYTNGKQIWH